MPKYWQEAGRNIPNGSCTFSLTIHNRSKSVCQKSSYDSRVKPIFANYPQTSSQTVHGRFTNCLWINKTIKGTLQSVDFSAGRAICRFFCRSCNLSIFLQVVQSVDFSAGRAICRFFCRVVQSVDFSAGRAIFLQAVRSVDFSAGRAIFLQVVQSVDFFCRPCNLLIFLQAVQSVDFSAGRAICRFFCRSCNLSIFLQGRAICRFFCRPCNLSIFLQVVQLHLHGDSYIRTVPPLPFIPTNQYRYLCKQCSSRWYGSSRAASPGSTVFKKESPQWGDVNKYPKHMFL